MKRWLKKHGKWVVVGLGTLFVANGILGIFIATEGWKVALHSVSIGLWLVIILGASGVLAKIYDWWEK